MNKLTPRSQNQAEWYQQVVLGAQLADYAPVRGCIVFRPYGYAIWDLIREELDKRIKKMRVDNAYFPLFIPYSFLEKEKKHVEGFAPEVAVVTHGGGQELTDKLVVRPTSETIIYSMFAKWVESYRDLPMKLNQWANVVRWEKRTLPFLRTSEFLWQEGHTLHASKDEAYEQVVAALKMYKDFLNEYLGLYVVAGQKTENEKFAGADLTYTVEGLMRDGKALQLGTSHLLSQSFVKSFDVKYVDESGKVAVPWATSWGMSTRTIGGVIMAHGDDKGLILPPGIAPVQVVVVPIYRDNRELVERYINESVLPQLTGYRTSVDWSEKTPGWKFAEWEMKGVPIRLEIGGKEAENEEVCVYLRHSGKKEQIPIGGLRDVVSIKIGQIAKEIYESHKQYTIENTHEVDNIDDFSDIIAQKKGYVKVYYNQGDGINEKIIKEKTKASTRCMPFVEEAFKQSDEKGKSFFDGSDDAVVTLFARAY